MSDDNQKWGVFLHRSNYRAFPIYKTRLNGWYCYQPFSDDGMPERRINGRSVGVYAEESAAQRVANQANAIFDSHQPAISEAAAKELWDAEPTFIQAHWNRIARPAPPREIERGFWVEAQAS